MGSGYWGERLRERGGLVVYDELVHGSVHEGLRLGRSERTFLPTMIRQRRRNASQNGAAVVGRALPWIAVESLYSMDGDRAPIDDLAALAERENAMLLIDEAHATGLFGPEGRGLAAGLEGQANVVTLRTCGKALGCEGALIMTGWGRTGTILACEQAGIVPDIICLSKGLTGGAIPLAVTMATEPIYAAHYGQGGRESCGYLSDLAPRLLTLFRELDMLLRPLGNTVYVMPPYCISSAELNKIYQAIEEACELI